MAPALPDSFVNTAPQPGSDSFTSSHTSNFPAILRHLGISLVVSTYQAGKLVWSAPGRRLNTHFRGFQSPMGMALAGDRLAIGTAMEIWEFRNVPARAAEAGASRQARRLLHAAFGPRHAATSGSTRWAGSGQRAVVRQHAILVPVHARPGQQLRAALAAAVRHRPRAGGSLPSQRPGHGGRPARSTSRPWARPTRPAAGARTRRRRRLDGRRLPARSCCRGLSMPHSPRWHDGRLWLLEVGHGRLGYVDLAHRPVRKRRRAARLHARAATSSATSPSSACRRCARPPSSAALPSRNDRSKGTCLRRLGGRSVADGQTVAFLRFEEAVQEIFAVTVLPGIVHPDLINEPGETLDSSFVLPDEALRDVPKELRRMNDCV